MDNHQAIKPGLELTQIWELIEEFIKTSIINCILHIQEIRYTEDIEKIQNELEMKTTMSQKNSSTKTNAEWKAKKKKKPQNPKH